MENNKRIQSKGKHQFKKLTPDEKEILKKGSEHHTPFAGRASNGWKEIHCWENVKRINESQLRAIVAESVKRVLNEIEEFTPHGYRTISNYGGNEIQISDSGDAARLKFQDGEVTDWLEIEFDEDGVAYVTTPYGQQEKLSDYMRY